ncbi:phosphoribosylformylglycinamidine synthase subunit PurQ [Sporosarcina highlanderae]|uniref:Phosphoribosylformylglycinamidine synthase subunit PurQ n=1 Tax=Sporosarcina highlanderae TaxID=3035916 RepID=A0ABT8JT77_9BACL|nr:phosphoribosylformylglycinamidine synthase subunit PurQ [Sporosarcina highlanderae]MDN4608284.1 phosphoribosylformylglycinamidine synthase subunit PurQ [Sporosarcina highlanderae]
MRFAILSFPGSSCDVDMLHAVRNVVGEGAEIVSHTDAKLENYDAVLLPTGASYGDYLRPGALAQSSKSIEALKTFADSGKPVLGVGNGFQVLVEAGILPGAFLRNKSLKFRSGNAKIAVQNASTYFTSNYEQGQLITIPFAHEYGNYYVDEDTLHLLNETNRIIFTYEDENTDGSVANIAGVLNEQGNVLGMMPLPERAVEEIIGGTDGLPLFQSILKNWSEKNVSHA